jgi:hypothetical protein
MDCLLESVSIYYIKQLSAAIDCRCSHQDPKNRNVSSSSLPNIGGGAFQAGVKVIPWFDSFGVALLAAAFIAVALFRESR